MWISRSVRLQSVMWSNALEIFLIATLRPSTESVAELVWHARARAFHRYVPGMRHGRARAGSRGRAAVPHDTVGALSDRLDERVARVDVEARSADHERRDIALLLRPRADDADSSDVAADHAARRRRCSGRERAVGAVARARNRRHSERVRTERGERESGEGRGEREEGRGERGEREREARERGGERKEARACVRSTCC